MSVFRLTAIATVLTLSACITLPKDLPQLQPLQDSKLGLAPAVSVAPARDWWNGFNDPALDRLMRQALADNSTLAQAMARVREAQAQADLARSGLYPSASFNARETRQRFSGRDVIPPPYAGNVQWEGREGLDLSWDLDFWGRQSSLLKQARSQTAAIALDMASARLAISGAVARTYIDLYRQQALVEVAERSQTQRQRILDITRSRVDAGLDTNVDLREAESAVPEAHVHLKQAQAAAELATHALAALAGRGTEAYAAILHPQLNPEAILPLPAALPVDLLGHRPDVLASRQRIEAATSGQAAAKAAFYPDVSLQAFAGTSAIGFDNLFKAASGFYGVGPTIHLPIFDAGRLKAEYRGATAEIDSAVAAYNETVLQAVRDTADQLSLVDALGYELAEQQKSLGATESAYRLAEERYNAGLSSYLTVLNAETQVLNARREHVELVSAQAIARVSLLLAVGGNFDPQAPLPL